MADTKISALPASTTPLAGTEVLPIVQSGVTRQVSVANLTAGRAMSATQLTLTTGSLVVANGQGIDFSATPGTGTSELLNDYEEGTWTPSDSSGAGLVFTSVAGHYTKIGRCVTAAFTVTYPVNSSANNARISLPFTSVTGDGNTGFYPTLTNSSLTFTGITVGTFLQFYDNALNTRTNVNFSGAIVRGVAIYYV